MAMSNQEKELLRKCAKDEQSYQQLLELFEKSSSTELDTDLTHRVDLAFLENTPSAIIICDARKADNPIVFVNKRFEQDTGYTREEVIGKNPRFMQGDDQQQAALTILRQALQNQKSCRVLLRNYRKDGTSFWNQINLAPIHDTSGIITHYISVQNDVTSQITLQEKLQQRISGRLNRYRNMVYSTQDGLALVNRDYIYEIVNDIYLDRSGLKRGEIEGRHVAEIIGEEFFQNIFKGYLDRSLSGEIVRHEDWFEFPEAGRRYIRLTYSPYRDENENGSIIGVLVNSRDITDNKYIEDELRESEARYRTVVHNFPNGLVALYDRDLRYTLVDGTGLAEVGLSPADLEGKKLRDVFPPEIYERDEPQLRAALNGQATDTIVTLGEDYFRVLTVPLRNSDNEIIGGMVMSQNISPLKRAEEALRESEEKYRVLVETNPDFISRLARDSTHLYANTALLKFLGKSPEQIIGKTNAEIGVCLRTVS